MALPPILEFDDLSLVPLLFGERNAHLHHLERSLNIDIADRGNTVAIAGTPDNVAVAEDVLKWMWSAVKKKRALGLAEIDAAIRFAREEDLTHVKNKKSSNGGEHHESLLQNGPNINLRRRTLIARTPKQAEYISALRHHEMIFGIGPAGTGKTYMAVAAGVEAYEAQKIERLVFCRPAVEAGEKLGFLPGDMREKIDPYLRPIYDALFDFLGAERVEKMLERGEIEIAPLAFMRGRTLSRAYVVLDEAQNTTSAQMKMFLSRMGEDTQMVVTGDPTQIDLPAGQISGLKEATTILGKIKDIAFIEFTNKDVVRHKLVGKILDAYDQNAGKKK